MLPALQAIGVESAEVRRVWSAFRYGAWAITPMLRDWQAYVAEQAEWQAHQYAGYYVKAVDITVYWRPPVKSIQKIYTTLWEESTMQKITLVLFSNRAIILTGLNFDQDYSMVEIGWHASPQRGLDLIYHGLMINQSTEEVA